MACVRVARVFFMGRGRGDFGCMTVATVIAMARLWFSMHAADRAIFVKTQVLHTRPASQALGENQHQYEEAALHGNLWI